MIGGNAAAVDRALLELAARGVRKSVKLPVSVPSHTPLMRDATEQLDEVMASLSWSLPLIAVIQNVDARSYDSVAAIKEALQRQVYLPARWAECVLALAAGGAKRIAECGPGKVLTGLCKRIDKAIDARALGYAADLDAARAAWSSE